MGQKKELIFTFKKLTFSSTRHYHHQDHSYATISDTLYLANVRKSIYSSLVIIPLPSTITISERSGQSSSLVPSNQMLKYSEQLAKPIIIITYNIKDEVDLHVLRRCHALHTSLCRLQKFSIYKKSVNYHESHQFICQT